MVQIWWMWRMRTSGYERWTRMHSSCMLGMIEKMFVGEWMVELNPQQPEQVHKALWLDAVLSSIPIQVDSDDYIYQWPWPWKGTTKLFSCLASETRWKEKSKTRTNGAKWCWISKVMAHYWCLPQLNLLNQPDTHDHHLLCLPNPYPF